MGNAVSRRWVESEPFDRIESIDLDRNCQSGFNNRIYAVLLCLKHQFIDPRDLSLTGHVEVLRARHKGPNLPWLTF